MPLNQEPDTKGLEAVSGRQDRAKVDRRIAIGLGASIHARYGSATQVVEVGGQEPAVNLSRFKTVRIVHNSVINTPPGITLHRVWTASERRGSLHVPDNDAR